MPVKSRWKTAAAPVIDENFKRIKAERPDLDDAKILRMVSRTCNPFPDWNWPYKMWLAAIRDYAKALRLPTKPPKHETLPLFGVDE